MRYYRCSSLPAAFGCGGSVQTPELKINPDSEPARDGHAGHDVMQIVSEADLDSIDGIDLGAIAKKHQVDADELAHAARNGVAIWRQIRESFPGARGEVDFAHEVVPDWTETVDGGQRPDGSHRLPIPSPRHGATLTGHADLLARDGNRANGADWKFGRVDKDYSEQVRGYMALTLLTYPEIAHVAWTIVWMREREVEAYSMDRERGLPEWLERFKREVVGWDGTYRPGPKNCDFCPRGHECPAKAALARQSVAMLTDGELVARIERGLVDLEPAEVVELYRRAKYIGRAADALADAVRARVEHDGGALDGGDGTELRLIPQNKRSLDTLAAWPVLEARLSPEDIAAVVKIGPSKLDDVIAAKAGKGNGASAKRELAHALEAAGAVRVLAGSRLSDQRKK